MTPISSKTHGDSIVESDPGHQKFKMKVSPNKQLLANTQPSAPETWKVFGDSDSVNYLSSATTLDQYWVACYYFHACLALVACEFAASELEAIFKDTVPNWICDGYKVE